MAGRHMPCARVQLRDALNASAAGRSANITRDDQTNNGDRCLSNLSAHRKSLRRLTDSCVAAHTTPEPAQPLASHSLGDLHALPHQPGTQLPKVQVWRELGHRPPVCIAAC